MPIMTDTTHDASVAFLEWLRPGGPWLLVAIEPDGTPIGKTVATVADARTFIASHDGRRNLYYSVNPTTTPIDKKAKKEDIAQAEFVIADLDPRADEKPEEAKQRYMA